MPTGDQRQGSALRWVRAGKHLLVAALQRVDAQVDVGAAGQRLAFFHHSIPESTGERGRQPFGIIALHPIGRIGRNGACRQRRPLVVAKRWTERTCPRQTRYRARQRCAPTDVRQRPARAHAGWSEPMMAASDALRRSTSNTRLPMALRSFEPAKRWVRPQSFSTSCTGRRVRSTSPSTSIAAAILPPSLIAISFGCPSNLVADI